jgi:hypothetical protein
MLKETTYKEKILLLKPWLSPLLEDIKKDIKNEHLKKDWQFCKRYLRGKSINKLTIGELVEAYSTALENSEKAEALAEFISNRWLLNNGHLYHYFEEKLTEINPNFSEIEILETEKAREIIQGAVEKDGSIKTYIFSVINAVVFPSEIFDELRSQAQQQKEDSNESQEKIEDEKASIESIKVFYEQQIARLTDKYEKKLTGLQKKYTQDTESLKKQISNLQRKMAKS